MVQRQSWVLKAEPSARASFHVLSLELFGVESSYPWRYFKEAVHLE